MKIDKEDAFWIGNSIGVVVLLATIIIVAPIKDRERKAYEAKQKADAAIAAQASETAKAKQTKNAKIARIKPTSQIETDSQSQAGDRSKIDINSIGASQAAGAAAASRQKLRS